MRRAKCDCFRWHRLRKTKEPDDETTANHTGMFNFANMSMSDSRAKQCSQLGVPARFVEARCYAATNKPIQVYLHHTLLLRQYVRQHEGSQGACSNVQAMCNMLSGCNEDLEQEIRQISGSEIAPSCR